MSTEIGRLNARITLQRAIDTKDSFGQIKKTWVEHQKVWAESSLVTGQETFVSAQVLAVSTRKFKLRFMQGVTRARMRIQYGNTLFNIQHIANLDERGRWLICFVSEVQHD